MGKTVDDLDRENARLLTIIASALAAMDNGLHGDARKILKTGEAKPLLAGSTVLAFPGGK